MNDDIALMWLNQSVVTINATLQLLDRYIYIYIYINNGEWYRKNNKAQTM